MGWVFFSSDSVVISGIKYRNKLLVKWYVTRTNTVTVMLLKRSKHSVKGPICIEEVLPKCIEGKGILSRDR